MAKSKQRGEKSAQIRINPELSVLSNRPLTQRANIYQTDFASLPRYHDVCVKSLTFVSALKPSQEVWKFTQKLDELFIVFIFISHWTSANFSDVFRLISVIILGQIFAILPVDGISLNDVEKLSFSFRSPKVIYTVLLQLLCVMEFILVAFSVGFTFDFFSVVLRYGIGVYTTLYMLLQARKWKGLMRCWEKNEEAFLRPPYASRARAMNFSRKAKVVAVLFIGYAICIQSKQNLSNHILQTCFSSVDHFFRMLGAIHREFNKHERCRDPSETFWKTAKLIYIQQRSIAFRYIDFEFWHIPIFEWIHISRRVAWGFGEVLIIIIALNLSMKFQQFNERLLRVHFQILWNSYWKESLDNYILICNLVDLGNEIVSPILCVITFADFFFLCERLYRQFQ